MNLLVLMKNLVNITKFLLMSFLVGLIKMNLCILTLMISITLESIGEKVVLTLMLGLTELFVIGIG